MMSGTGIMVPVQVSWLMLSSEKSSRVDRITLIGLVKAMVTFGCDVTNFEADLPHRVSGIGEMG